MKQFRVFGMTCAACVSRVEKAVLKVDGVKTCAVSLLTNSLSVEGDVQDEQIIKAVEKAGYTASVMGKEKEKTQNDDQKDTKILKTRLFSSLIFLIILMYISMGHSMFGFPLSEIFVNPVINGLTQFILCIIVLVINQKFFINGYKSLFKLSPNMDSLVALSSTAALVYSVVNLYSLIIFGGAVHFYFETSAMIVTLITIGKTLEAYSKGKTTSALKSLISLTPKTAVILINGEEKTIPVEQVKKGDIFVVYPGSAIPVDGEIIEGVTAINESALTGESIPQDKDVGDTVSAGTINLSGFVKCKATKVGQDTTLSQIIKLVQDASATKAPIAKIADKVSGVFVPVVIAISIITFVVWALLGREIGFSLSRAMAVLVISCPCALGLATPVAIVVGSGKGARKGILFKTAEAIEEIGKIDIVALDKTGTITEGHPKVITVISENGEKLLSLAFSLEQKSEHPLSKAVCDYAKEKGILAKTVTNFSVLPGNGLEGEIEGERVFGGSEKFISSKTKISEKYKTQAEELSKNGQTPLFFATETQVLGIIAVADTVKKDSKQAIESLHNLGIKVVMITGDNQKVGESIAKEVGIDQVFAGVLPDGKEKVIRELKTRGKVAMIGDGINDAPALVSADVGIAIGAGSDIAIDSASVVLVKSKLTDAVRAIRLGRKTLKNVKQNLFWAFIYNVLGIPLAAGVFFPIFGWVLNPMIGAAAMSLSSVCVVSNALRLNLLDIESGKSDKPKKKRKSTKKEKKMEKTLIIDGMMCMHCVARVKKILESVEGVTLVDVSLDDKTAKITLSKEISNDYLKDVIEKDGYSVVEIK